MLWMTYGSFSLNPSVHINFANLKNILSVKRDKQKFNGSGSRWLTHLTQKLQHSPQYMALVNRAVQKLQL